MTRLALPTRRRAIFLLLAVAALALLTGIGWWIGQQTRPQPASARPALWHLVQGEREAYLLGTLHVVPPDSRWLGPGITRAVGRSDRLILEVTGLEAERQTGAVFARLGQARGLPPVTARLTAEDAERLRVLAARDPRGLHGIDGYKSWAAALLVNASAASRLSLSSDAAPERQLSRLFAEAGKPVAGLETIAGQLGLFDDLDETDQRRLLTQSVREAEAAPRLYGQLYAAWATGDLDRIGTQFLAPLAAAPALRAALVERRNARWAQQLDSELGRAGAVTFIAVGAGHLVGPDSLLAAMTARGWQVERLQ